jgi:hypothetical protein
MTGKNTLVAIGFAIITVTQLVLGILLIVNAVEKGGEAKSCTGRANCLFAPT